MHDAPDALEVLSYERLATILGISDLSLMAWRTAQLVPEKPEKDLADALFRLSLVQHLMHARIDARRTLEAVEETMRYRLGLTGRWVPDTAMLIMVGREPPEIRPNFRNLAGAMSKAATLVASGVVVILPLGIVERPVRMLAVALSRPPVETLGPGPH